MPLLTRLIGRFETLSGHPAFAEARLRALARIVGWAARCALRIERPIGLPSRRLRLHLPLEWHGTSRLIYIFRDRFEPELACLGRFLKSGDAMIDVGGHVGLYALIAARLVGPQGRVISVEPGEAMFDLLQRNIALNGLGNVTALKLALAEREGTAELYHAPSSGRSSLGAYRRNVAHESVTLTRLDSLVERAHLARLALIKIDVEGAEELVLRGAGETLRRFAPVILFEVNPGQPTRRLQLPETGSWDILSAAGYRFFALGADCRLSALERPPTTWTNVIALPEATLERFLADGDVRP